MTEHQVLNSPRPPSSLLSRVFPPSLQSAKPFQRPQPVHAMPQPSLPAELMLKIVEYALNDDFNITFEAEEGYSSSRKAYVTTVDILCKIRRPFTDCLQFILERHRDIMVDELVSDTRVMNYCNAFDASVRCSSWRKFKCHHWEKVSKLVKNDQMRKEMRLWLRAKMKELKELGSDNWRRPKTMGDLVLPRLDCSS